MKKIFFIIFSMFIFTISFSDSAYKVTTGKNVKLSSTDLKNNNSQIENQLAMTFNPQTYDAAKIKKLVLNIDDAATTKEEDILINSMSSLIKAYVSNSKYQIQEISYTDAETAKITISATSPKIMDYVSANEQVFEKQAEKNFKTLSGKTVEQVDKDTVNQDKYAPILMASFVSAIADSISSVKDFSTQSLTIEMKKVNGTWISDDQLINNILDFKQF